MKLLRRQVPSIFKCKLVPALLGLLFVRAALATVPLYDNSVANLYYIPGAPPPTIDAVTFQNEPNIEFAVGFAAYTPFPELYETWNTLNYTNLGVLVANSPTVTNGAFFIGYNGNFGSGFNFDRQTTNQISHQIAGSFYNAGDIRCDSLQDGNNIFTINLLDGYVFNFYLLTSIGQFKAWATNIVNPGSIEVGTGGLLQMTGTNLDLTGGSLTLEPLLNSSLLTFFNYFNYNTIFNAFSTAQFSGLGAAGGSFWDPGLSLTATTAVASYPFFPNPMTLTNSTAYIDDEDDPLNPGVKVHRAVFLVNNSPDGAVTANVYFDPLYQFSQFGLVYPGCVNIGWSANTVDPASGNPVNNYLYLTDDYLWGGSTNVAVLANGQPDNFVFSTSPNPLLFSPAPSGFVNEFPNIVTTNLFAYMNGSLVPSTITTNASGWNPSGNITNLPSAIKLSAANTLNLAYTTISGPNYLSLFCTNQFQGSPGATISAPYSDIALGVTNGFLTFSNVLMAGLPAYSGNVQAWTTRFISVDALGVTNDFRILLVYSAFEPSSPPWIQHLYAHGTNTLNVSDHLNVYGSIYSDAAILTLQTNQVGVGATSLDGELYWDNTATFNANSGSGTQQFPNLLWVTNYGAIRTGNNANFGSAAAPQSAVTSISPAMSAMGTLSQTVAGTNAAIGDQVTIGTNQYTFVGTLTNTRANQIKWGATVTASLNNLIAAVNGAAGAGTNYSSATKPNASVTAGPLAGHAFTVTARTAGVAGNSMVTTFTPAKASVVNLAWGGATLAGGADIVYFKTPTSFNNHSLLADQGTAMWTTYFDSDGTISNGSGSFILYAGLAVLNGLQPPTNGNVVAGGDIIIVATNTPGLGMNGILISNVMLKAGHKLTLLSTNIYDSGVSNGNIFVVGAASGGGTLDSGFNVPVMPPVGAGSLLGTTVTNIAPPSKTIYNVWAGTNRGLSNLGFTNNLALGHLVLDSLTTNLTFPPVAFVFNGVGVSNALYVDLLELKDGATQGSNTFQYNFPWLHIGTNMVIYYARAILDVNGQSYDDSEAIDWAGQFQNANGGRLRWISSYPGYFSTTNYYFTNSAGAVITQPENIALAQSTVIDSDADGIPNAKDTTPFFLPPELNFTASVTNLPPKSAKIEWTTIPNAVNYVYYTTNLLQPVTNAFTNFAHWYYGNNVAVTNAAHVNYFTSPQLYANVATTDNAQQTNVWVCDAVTNVPPRYYRVVVWPQLNLNQTNAP